MRAKTAEREAARSLRAQGVGVRQIAARLGVSKASVSVWVRDVPVPVAPPAVPAELDPRAKRCGRCGEELSLSRFNRDGDGHQHWCRECFRAYFKERGSLHLEQVRAASEARRAPGMDLVRRRLAMSSCADCGEDEFAVLEFDHVEDKQDPIAELMWSSASLPALREEMDRCEVVCASCHRRRTARRAGWPRFTGVADPRWPAPRRRNFERIRHVLAESGCVDCGERDLTVLEFDHVGPRRHKVAQLALGASLARLNAELEVCEVRCCNCHRLATQARRGGGWRDAPDWAV